jgi:hypothetical protein
MEYSVPLWVARDKATTADWRRERPVLITLEAQGLTMYGHIRTLTTTSAEIVPESPCVVRRQVSASVRFRSNDTLFSLTGLAISSASHESILLQLSEVTREDVGLTLPAAAHQPQFEVASAPFVQTKAAQHVNSCKPSPVGADPRIEQRYHLETPVRLAVLDTALILHARMLDINMRGCRIFSDDTFELPPETHLEVQFVGLGLPFRLAATIKSIEGRVNDLCFLPASIRCKEHLMEMVGDLVERQAGAFFRFAYWAPNA